VTRVMSIRGRLRPEPDLFDAEPLGVGEPAVGHREILTPETPRELRSVRDSHSVPGMFCGDETPIPPSW
jgi:hypothetical protein